MLFLCSCAVHSLAKDYFTLSVPGSTPHGILYKRAKENKKAKLGSAKGLRFALFGDWGMNTKVHDQVSDNLFRFQKVLKSKKLGLEAVLLAGDNFYSKGVKSLDDKRWEQLWGKPFRRIGVPFFVTLGNHDYGYGPDKAQLQVEKSGKPGFELWRCEDANGLNTPGIYYDHWFTSEDFAIQVVFIDTNLLLVSRMRRTKMWGKQLAWLDQRLSKAPPPISKKQSKDRRVLRFVLGHHVLACFGEKENEVIYMNAPQNRVGPNGTNLMDIIRSKATAYLCGHAHTVEYIHLGGEEVIPKKGPIHGRTRVLEEPVPLQIISGTGAQVRQKSYWDKSCYYVARLPGFSVLSFDKDGPNATMTTHFVDCRGKRPKIIYSLRMPLRDQSNGTKRKGPFTQESR